MLEVTHPAVAGGGQLRLSKHGVHAARAWFNNMGGVARFAGVVGLSLMALAGCAVQAPDDFFEAIKAGDEAAVRAALDAHPDWARARDAGDPEFNGRGARPAIYWAIINRNKAITELLLARGEDVNVRCPQDTTLSVAVQWRCNEIVELLIARGANINAREGQWLHYTPLLRAAEQKNAVAAKLLIDAGADVRAKDDLGKTPLHRAFWCRDFVEMLLARGAEVNAKSADGDTPLHQAASLGNRDVVEILLAHGADVNARNSEGQTPLHKAGRRAAVADLLIAHGADVNAADSHGDTPARWKFLDDIKVGDVPAVQAAVDAHPSWVSAADSDGWPPLCLAAMYGHKALAELLIARGAPADDKTTFDDTPLHIAVQFGCHSRERGYIDLVILLLARHADVNARNLVGVTPLHKATKDCNKGASIFVQLLVDAGADGNARNKEHGDTPLHQAAYCASLEQSAGGEGEKVVRILLAHEADANVRNSEGRTPADMAQGNENVVRLLKESAKGKPGLRD